MTVNAARQLALEATCALADRVVMSAEQVERLALELAGFDLAPAGVREAARRMAERIPALAAEVLEYAALQRDVLTPERVAAAGDEAAQGFLPLEDLGGLKH